MNIYIHGQCIAICWMVNYRKTKELGCLDMADSSDKDNKKNMTESDHINKPGNYDVTTIVIGGLKDFNVIYKAIDSYFSINDTVEDLISGRNEFNLRTERSRVRIETAINQAFLQFKNQDHKDLIHSLFQSNAPRPDKELILFWQFSLNNRLFNDISSQVFIKTYLSGRTHVSKGDIIAFQKELFHQNKQLNINWSESTINTLSTKYLSIMTKFNFLAGTRIKFFRHIKISTESLVLFLYFAKLHDPQVNNIIKNEFLPLSFVASEDIRERLKKLSLKGFFNMNFNGVALNIELTHSYKGICDALYN